MICSNCGTANRDGANFCRHCAHMLLDSCPACGVSLPEQADFCDNCAFPLTISARRQWPLPAHPRDGEWRPPRPAAPSTHDSAREIARPESVSLEQFVPEELLHKLEVARSSGGMVGERRTVTMLFCDVKGSTAAAEQMDPEEWTEIINGAFERMIRPVYKYEGTLARLMGDAILAFFGAPIAHEDDPQRAVLAGLDIVAGMIPYREEIAQRHGIDFDVRVGINTGRVVVGAVGSDLRMEYSAMGDAVNLAARMEQTATPGTVHIAAGTYHLVEPLFEFEPLGPTRVKGKAEPVLTYRVIAPKAAPGRLRGIKGLGAELIGRESEWSQLESAAGALRKGVGQIVFLTGEAGLGKSRLIAELRHSLDNGGDEQGLDPAWFEASAMSYETAQPYSLIQRLFRQILAAAETDSPEQTRRRVDQLAEQLPEDEREALVAVAEALLGLEAAGGGSPLQGEGFKGQLYVVTASLIRRMASRRPLLLACDDLHWCDPASAALLAHLFPLTGEAPLMLLCASRTDQDTPGWALKETAGDSQALRYTGIDVRPLTAGESSKLVDSLLSISDLPEQLRSRILDKSEGNPFFVEEVVRSLIESGSVTQSADGLRWKAGDAGAAIDVPGNLQTLLTARMDRLEDDERRVLQVAAIVGRAFAYRVLERVASDDNGRPDELESKLNALQHADLIREAARLPELEYIFRHSLTQEAAYHTILRRQRAHYHRRVGETIEALYPGKLAENAAALAHHFDQAGDKAKLFHYAVMAGDEAFRLFAHAEALDHYDRALEVAGDAGAASEQILQLYLRRGRTLELDFQYAEAGENYRQLESLAAERDDPAFELAAANARATIYAIPSPVLDTDRAMALAGRALELAHQLGDRAAESRALWNRLLAARTIGEDLNQAAADGEESLAIARELDLEEQLAFSAHDLSAVYSSLGDRQRFDSLAGESRQFFSASSNLPMLSNSYQLSSNFALQEGKLDEGRRDSEEALRLSRAIGNVWREAAALSTLGLVAGLQGDSRLALSQLDEAIDFGKKAGIPGMTLFAMTGRAQPFALLGVPDLLLEQVKKTHAVAGDAMPLSQNLAMRGILALFCLEVGEVDVARSLMNVDKPVHFSGRELGWVSVYPVLAEVAMAAHDREPGELLPTIVQLVEEWRQANLALGLLGALRLQGRLQAEMGQREGALESLTEALQMARAEGARADMQSILTLMLPLVDDPAEVEKLQAEAAEVVAFIAGHAPSDELRQRYLASPLVRPLLPRDQREPIER